MGNVRDVEEYKGYDVMFAENEKVYFFYDCNGEEQFSSSLSYLYGMIDDDIDFRFNVRGY